MCSRDPLRLSQFLLTHCIQRGVHLHHPAKAICVSKNTHDELASVRVASTDSDHEVDIPCTRILIAAGAWSPQVFQALFPNASIRLPVTSLAGHSLVLRSPRWTTRDEENGCHAVFTTDVSGYSPEIFSRLGGEIYIAGVNSSSIPLPEIATESRIEEPSILKLEAAAEKLLGIPGDSGDLEIVRKGLCFRPVTDNGTPILARIPDEKLGVDVKTRGGSDGGVFLAAGHGPWGISMSVGTGKVMAEMIQGLPMSADVTELGF
jgi:glycine/D-amino acid oxidase-like deaminating enzyme